MIGLRTLPASTGGVERHVEELGARLVERGHDVTAFVRNPSPDGARRSSCRGMEVRHVASVRTKHLETISHTALSAMHALTGEFDVVHYHSIGPGIVAPVTRWGSRAKVVLTVHGLDDQRSKWARPAQLVLLAARWMSERVPDVTVTDAAWMAAIYANNGCPAVHVRNGVSTNVSAIAARRRRPRPPGWRPSVLFVGRLVPEKRADLLVRAFAAVPGDARLVIVGDGSYTDRHATEVASLARRDRRVELVGTVHGPGLDARWEDAALFCLPSVVEGLPLSMLDAAGCGVPIVASDVPAHREILCHSAPGRLLVPPDEEAALAAALSDTLADLATADRGADRTRRHVLARYDWESTTDAIEAVYEIALARAGPALRDAS